jgi:hypothetical protein
MVKRTLRVGELKLFDLLPSDLSHSRLNDDVESQLTSCLCSFQHGLESLGVAECGRPWLVIGLGQDRPFFVGLCSRFRLWYWLDIASRIERSDFQLLWSRPWTACLALVAACLTIVLSATTLANRDLILMHHNRSQPPLLVCTAVALGVITNALHAGMSQLRGLINPCFRSQSLSI